MRVLKVVAEGITTSFRYPHFMQQIHPTFPMPPPATIYGHICSALGEWFDPTGVQFAYHFTSQGTVHDMEHIIVLSPKSGRSYLPGTKIPKVLEGKVNPFERELLFLPRLTLYINRPEWISAFHSPRYAVVLGRSQDLFTYTHVDVIELEQAEHAYFEHTIAPHEMALRTMRGVTLLMPRYLDYARNREPTFSRYVVISNRVRSDRFIQFSDRPNGPYWVDPTTPCDNGAHLGLPFLSFTGEENDRLMLA
jgi:CRISPR-associated protein Cas5t